MNKIFILLFFIILVLVLYLLIFLNFILSKKMFKDREKMSSFECGFDPMSNNRLPFSLHFYLVGIIFLIFDIEIAVIIPYVFVSVEGYYFLIFTMVMIILILLIGLYMEWWEGALMWFK